LKLGKENAWRRIIIPAEISFGKFHRVIQDAFRWQDYHLYKFALEDKDKTMINILSKDAIEEGFSAEGI
jgi:hypothetical protein